VSVTQDEDPQVSANERWDSATRLPGETLRRSERVRNRTNVANLTANETAELPGLALGATQQASGYAATNHHLQMKEWAFEDFLREQSPVRKLGLHSSTGI